MLYCSADKEEDHAATIQEHASRPLPFILSLLGVSLALMTSWLGGELVERLGVGVDAGANLDAPSSLSGQPATASGRPPHVPPQQTRRTT